MAFALAMLLLGTLAVASLVAIARPFAPYSSRRQAALGAGGFSLLLLLTPIAYIFANQPSATSPPLAAASADAVVELGPGTPGWKPVASPAPTVSNPRPARVPISNAFERAALASCERYVKAAASHPSTVSFSILGSNVEMEVDGAAIVTSTFTARNSFNLEVRHDIRCRVTQAGEISAVIAEGR